MNADAQGVRPATPLPWQDHSNGKANLGTVGTNYGRFSVPSKQDAAYIVHAANSLPALEAEVAKLRAERAELVAALRYIARGYSGEVGNAEGHSGTHCAETARALLERLGE